MASANAAAGAPSQAVPLAVATNAVGGVPPTAAGGAPLQYLPSCRQLLDRGPNDSISLTLLQAVDTTDAHTPNARKGFSIKSFQQLLWNDTGTGAFDGRFVPFSSGARMTRNLRERITSIINHHSQHTDAYPTPLQMLATRLFDEIEAHNEEVDQRRNTAQRQATNRQSENNLREGVLGALPRGRGTSVPSLPNAANHAVARQAQQAAGLLAQNPRSQNNNGAFCVSSLFLCHVICLKTQNMSLFSIPGCPVQILPPAPVVPVVVAGRPNADAVAWEEYDRVHGSSHPNNAGTIMQRQMIPPAPAVPVVVAGRPAGGAAAAVGTGAGAIGAGTHTAAITPPLLARGGRGRGGGGRGRGLGDGRGRGGGGRGRGRTGAGGAAVTLAGALADAASNRVGGASNSRAANLAERRRTGATVASQAASDDEPRHIDQANASNMRRGRTIDSVDVLDSMNSAIIQSTRSLIGALNRNSNGGGGQRQQQPQLQQQSLAEEIRDLYQLRSLTQAAGNTASVERYNQTIARAEDELLARPSRRRRLSDAGAGGNANGNAGGNN